MELRRKLLHTKVSAEVWPPIVPMTASVGIGPIGGQAPAETLVYTIFAPKLELFTTPGNALERKIGSRMYGTYKV